MKKYYKYFAILTAVLLFNCEAEESTTLENFIGFEQGALSLKIPRDGTNTQDVKVYASEISSTDRSYPLAVDTQATTFKAVYDVPATVTIPANSNVGTFTVSFTDDDKLAFVSQSLVIKFPGEAGRYFGDPITIKATELCTDTFIRLSLTFDSWPEETTVELFDLSGDEPESLFKGGPYDGLASAFTEFCLLPGEYGVAVYDEYGDGGATYTITAGSTVYVPKTTSESATSTAKFTIE